MSRATRWVLPLMAALLLAPAAAGANEELGAGLRVVFDELEAWDLPAARAAANELSARAADSPQAKLAQARVAFEEGNYPKAVELFDAAGARGDAADLARAAAKETKGYEARESQHFIFLYRPGKEAVLAPYALDALERQYAALARDLGHAPREKIRVEIFDDARALSRVSTLSLEAIKTTGTVAICKFNRLMVTSPKALVRGYDWLDTIAHEYVHLVVSQASRNTVPIWIHEGLAKFFESDWRGGPGLALSPASAAQLAQALGRDRLIPFEKMHPSIALLPSQEDAALAYAEVFTAIEFLFKKGGQPALLKMLGELRGGARPDAAVAAAASDTFAAFQRDWRAWLAKRPFPKEVLPLSPEKLKFKEDDARAQAVEKAKKDPKAQEEIRFGDFLEIEDSQGRRLAHLGELMRERHRTRAAAEEFARAYARVGDRSPTLSNRYAQVLMELKKLPEAEKLLTASLKPFPEFPKTHQNLADIYIATERPAEAEKALLAVVGIDPFDPLPHAQLHKIYTARGDALRSEREKVALGLLVEGKAPAAASNQGAIVVRSHPFARVILDGVDTGRSTPTQLLVPPGTHVVKLVNEERGISREQPVAVNAGEEQTVDVQLGDK